MTDTRKYLIFENPGEISLLDLLSMGDSDKRDDESKIGKYDSGLKYALAILFRNNVKVRIYAGEHREFCIGSTILKDETTDKVKEVLTIIEYDDIALIKTHITGFSPRLGYDWEFWMAIREIYSNCLDEKGRNYTCDELPESEENDTKIIIEITDKVQNVIDNWNIHFNTSNYITEDNGLKISWNTNGHLKFYKNSILIYENPDIKTPFSYDWLYAEIDERRIIRDKYDMERAIATTLCRTANLNIIDTICKMDNEDTFESSLELSYNTFSEFWIKRINELYQSSRLSLPTNFRRVLSEKDEVEIGVRRLSSSQVYTWYKAEVVEIPEEEKETTFEDKIRNISKRYNFEIKYPIKESKISGMSILPDVRKKVIYISKEFSEKDMWMLVQAHFRIDSNDKLEYVYKKYVELLLQK
jgi:hypothetical protein